VGPVTVRILLIIQPSLELLPENVNGDSEVSCLHVVKPECGDVEQVARLQLHLMPQRLAEQRKLVWVRGVDVEDTRLVSGQVEQVRLVRRPQHRALAPDHLQES